MENNRAFQPLTEEDNLTIKKYGCDIYDYIRYHFPENDTKSLDILMNSIVFALIITLRNHCEEDNRKILVQCIYKILDKNI